jgi:ubiquinone/menaquinone biosynthesis C-methylase UbiE
MSFYRNRVYPGLVQRLGNPPPVRELRRKLVPLAVGRVLEIGVGSGANFPYYDPSKVTHLFALDPNPRMRRLAEEQQRRTSLQTEFLSLPGEQIPLEDESIDTVVSTFTLCTIGPVKETLTRLAQVLRPGGRLLFLENCIADDSRVRQWQRWWEPLHHRIFEGLILTRDIPSLIANADFQLERVESVYLSRFPKSWSHCCWGTAMRT